jgi:DNA-binding response OmpR family regulator
MSSWCQRAEKAVMKMGILPLLHPPTTLAVRTRNQFMHVLIIEDEQGITSGLSGFLETKGHVVDTAGRGISSRHLALVGQYDAIMIDVMLPEMDGLALCRELREEGCKATPILMISVRDSLDDKVACLEAGADDFLVKRVTLAEIESRLRVLFRLDSRSGANAMMLQKQKTKISVNDSRKTRMYSVRGEPVEP